MWVRLRTCTHPNRLQCQDLHGCSIPLLLTPHKALSSCDQIPFTLCVQLMNNLNFKEAASELSQAADYLRSTGSAKVGCTGQ